MPFEFLIVFAFLSIAGAVVCAVTCRKNINNEFVGPLTFFGSIGLVFVAIVLIGGMVHVVNMPLEYDDTKTEVAISGHVNGVDVVVFKDGTVLNLNARYSRHIPVGTKIAKRWKKRYYDGILFTEPSLHHPEHRIIEEPESLIKIND